jgi:hypothetical protein
VAGIATTALTIRLAGDDLDPIEITRLLGAEPSSSSRMGDARQMASGRSIVARTGSWRLKSDDRTPGDLSTQIKAMLGKLTSDLEVWVALTSRFRCNCFCGLFMAETNEGLVLEPEVLAMLSARGLTLMLDIYGCERD